MPDYAFIVDSARRLYGFEPRSIAPLDDLPFSWRGIYRVEDPRGGAWVMRLLLRPAAAEVLGRVARLLVWLARRGYPAPTVRPTTEDALVGVVDGWAIVLLSFVDGAVLEPHAAGLGALAESLGHLHRLRVDDPTGFAPSRCHPDALASAAAQLSAHRGQAPPAFAPLADTLHAALLALQQLPPQPLCLTHGDCWYRNGIQTGAGSVTLIDWDQAGLGLGALDLGNLLLTAHFDLRQPLRLVADEACIAAIMRGYQRYVPVPQQRGEQLAHTLLFLLAWQLGSSLADPALVEHPEFPHVLAKLQARAAAAPAIADIAVRYIGATPARRAP